MKGRQQPGQNPKPALHPNDLEKMKRESMAILEVQFHNNTKSMRFWSKCGQRKHTNMNEAINYLMWLVTGYKKWQGTIHRAAIFDARSLKYPCAGTKLYQYENRTWYLEQPINW